MDLHSVAEDHTQSKKLAVLRSTMSTVETKQKLPGNVECRVIAYKIRFEQAEEHTGLTDKEERKTMKKRRMRTEEIKHDRVDYILHLDESIRLSVYASQSISNNRCS